MSQILLTFIFLIAISVLLFITEMIYKKLELKGELTRKFAHSVATLSTISFPFLFDSHWYVLSLVIFFFAVLLISSISSKLKSIHDINRKSTGSYLLPIGIYVPFLVSNKMGNEFLFVLPMLVLGISDPFAGIMGMYNRKNNNKIKLFGKVLDKTFKGTSGFLISSFVISVVALSIYKEVFNFEVLVLAVSIAVVSSFVELLSGKGFDNFFVPASVMGMLILFL